MKLNYELELDIEYEWDYNIPIITQVMFEGLDITAKLDDKDFEYLAECVPERESRVEREAAEADRRYDEMKDRRMEEEHDQEKTDQEKTN
jgi:hypothetical protein